MPKIIDHDAYRLVLTEKAVEIFARYGYSGLGMRKIAEHLGISKSALYHYFPSKEALFSACTDLITRFEMPALDVSEMSITERVDLLMNLFQSMEGNFKGELTLLLDYLRDMTPSQVAKDRNMQLANKRYLQLVTELVGSEHAEAVRCMMYGILLQRFLDGRKTDFEVIRTAIHQLLQIP
ncbi:helix-turn-helix domain-containing protein [Gynuella sp.]|uniref:helix-turn-helix domain-containing protein n=1 Tax=Gynuella sp. TaxID=2969146 RepID=UPI003D10AF92